MEDNCKEGGWLTEFDLRHIRSVDKELEIRNRVVLVERVEYERVRQVERNF